MINLNQITEIYEQFKRLFKYMYSVYILYNVQKWYIELNLEN